MNVAEMIVKGLEISELDKKYKLEKVDTFCGITGEPITQGIKAQKVVSSNTGEFLDLLHGRCTEYLGEMAARAFKGSWNMGSRLIFADGTMYHPLISNKSAEKQGRACWSSLVRDIWPVRKGEECLCIIATDFKKKVWPWAKTGVLGNNTPVLLFDSKTDTLSNFYIDWQALVTILDEVEYLYTAGFSKQTIALNLWSDYSTAIEFQQTIQYEEKLRIWRQLPEFRIAIVIAQKPL